MKILYNKIVLYSYNYKLRKIAIIRSEIILIFFHNSFGNLNELSIFALPFWRDGRVA